MDTKRAAHGLPTDISRTGYGQITDFTRAANGHLTDGARASNGLATGLERTSHGHLTGGGVERVACRAGACVFVGCSFCVRSRPVWRSSCVGSCGVRARRQIARGVRARRQIARRLTGGSQRRQIVEVKHKAADATRAHHGRITDFTRTGDGRASVRLGRIQLSQDGRRRAVGGLATDLPTDFLRTDNGRHTDAQRASDRLGHRLETDT